MEESKRGEAGRMKLTPFRPPARALTTENIAAICGGSTCASERKRATCVNPLAPFAFALADLSLSFRQGKSEWRRAISPVLLEQPCLPSQLFRPLTQKKFSRDSRKCQASKHEADDTIVRLRTEIPALFFGGYLMSANRGKIMRTTDPFDDPYLS